MKSYKSQLKKCLKEGNAYKVEKDEPDNRALILCQEGNSLIQCTSFNCKKLI